MALFDFEVACPLDESGRIAPANGISEADFRSLLKHTGTPDGVMGSEGSSLPQRTTGRAATRLAVLASRMNSKVSHLLHEAL